MANTITVQGNFELRQGSTLVLPWAYRKVITQTGQLIQWDVLNVTTTEVTYSVSGLTTPGIFMAYNLDATNYVQWGKTSTDYIGRMRAEEAALPMRLDGNVTNLYFKANTAACKVFVAVCQD